MQSISKSLLVTFSRQLSQVLPRGTQSFTTFERHKMISLSLCTPAKFIRNLSVQPITKRIKLITEHDQKVEKKQRSENDVKSRPLALILTWLMAKPKQQAKFTQLYIDQGFDVLLMETKANDIFWPTAGTKVITLELLEYLAKNERNYEKMVVHGFSVGGYVWGEIMQHLLDNPSRYQPVMDRIVAQTWDSVAGLTEVHIGVSQAIFKKNEFMRKMLENLIALYMRVFYDSFTRHLVNSSNLFDSGIVKAPALYFASKVDPIGTERGNRAFADSWIKAGVDVTWKCFESSPHVTHFVTYREEYLKFLFNHLRSVDMLKK